MTPYQRTAFEAPLLAFGQGQDPSFWHEERGFRVGVHVNATGNVAADGTVREPWPYWVVTAVYSETRAAPPGSPLGPQMGPAKPLLLWKWPERRRAARLIKAHLAGVGAERTQEIPSADWLLDELERHGRPRHELCALSGWRRMTMDEAVRCFAEYPEVRARINRTWGLLDGHGTGLSGAGGVG